MSAWGARQSYPAAVWTTVVLAVIFALSALLRPLIPPPDPNPVASNPGGFMVMASPQRIRWKTLLENPFALAKQADKPVFLVVGSEWSHAARRFDSDVLKDPQIAERLNREFVAVRVDGEQNPEWSGGPFPLAMALAGVDPGFHIQVLQPDGRPLAWIGSAGDASAFDPKDTHKVLNQALKTMVQGDRKGDPMLVQTEATESEFLLGRSSSGTGDLSVYTANQLQGLSEAGYLAESGQRKLFPWEWTHLLNSGSAAVVQARLRSLATSNAVDWTDGGFFRVSGPNRVRFDKVVSENAAMVCAMAECAAKTLDPFLRLVARQQAERLLDQFAEGEEAFGWSYLNSGLLGRSTHHSLSTPTLELNFSPGERQFLRSKLGIDPGADSTMIPHIVDPDGYVSDPLPYSTILKKWARLATGPAPIIGGAGLCKPTCELYARLEQASRALGDDSLAQRLDSLFVKAQAFRTGTELVVHSTSSRVDGVPYLGDYLAYSDACLQRFLSRGDQAALTDGLAVLKRAQALFSVPGTPAIGLVPADRVMKDTPWTQWPNWIDGADESENGRLVRLMNLAAAVLRDQPEGARWREGALEQIALGAPLTRKLSLRLGGLCNAASLVLADRFAVVSGPAAGQRAFALAGANPSVPVVPALGPVHKALQGETTQVVVYQSGQPSTPMGLDEARTFLRTMP